MIDFNIRQHTILLVKSGSRAYGIHTDASDLDVRGVAIAPKKYYLSLSARFAEVKVKDYLKFFQDALEGEETKNGVEGEITDFKKYISLVVSNNPTLLDVLFCRDQDVLIIDNFGEIIRANRDVFLCSKARFSYGAYATDQAKKMGRHREWLLNPPKAPPTRKDFGLPETYPKAKYDVCFDAIQKKLDSWKFDLSALPSEDRTHITYQISNYLAELGISTDDEWRKAAKLVGFDDNLIHVLEQERKFRKSQDNWKSYQRWLAERNPERAEKEAKVGYCAKNAVHLVRLMRMCRELLTTGKVNVWRGDIDAAELLDIRNGAWSYEKLMEYVDSEDKVLTEIYKSNKMVLKDKVNMEIVDDLFMEMLEEYHAPTGKYSAFIIG